MEQKKIYACFWVVLIISAIVNARPQDMMDLVERDADGNEANPGWIHRQLIRVGDAARRAGSSVGGFARRQLIRAGEAASRVGSGVGGYAVRLTNAVDKICGVIKKIIPIVGAVCTVGQFKFCALDNATGGLDGGDGFPGIEGRSAAFPSGPQTDLDAIDK